MVILILQSIETNKYAIKLRNKFAFIKDTYREKVPSSKTPALTKSRIIVIWVTGTSDQLFVRGS